MPYRLSSKRFYFRLSVHENWKWLLTGSIFSFFLASILLSGWPAGLIPNVSTPYVYGNDGTFCSWMIQHVMDGWFFDNSREGYPFSSSFLDYPGSDSGNLVILKLLGLFTGNYYSVLNLYLLLGFPLDFIAAFLVFRAFGIRPAYSFAGALLFSFSTFHLWRLFGHIFYTWYFVVPIYFFYAWKIFLLDPSMWPLNHLKTILSLLISLIVLSSFGVYYAFFGVIIFIVSGCAGTLKNKRPQELILSILLSSMIACGVGLNVLPNIIHQYKKGPNPEVAYRSAKETEIFGLKIAHLLFPSADHRVKFLRHPVNRYGHHFDVSEATYSSSLGFFATIGFLIIIFSIFFASLGKHIKSSLGFLAVLVLSLLFFSMVGGLNVLFSLFFTPLIRGWNRISIFISFASLTALFLTLQGNKKLESFYRKKWCNYLIPTSIIILGLLDQTAQSYLTQTTNSKKAFLLDREFITKLEAMLPSGSPIYQLPYMTFPEHGSLINLPDYSLMVGYLHSKTLRWSHGNIKGREEDFFYRYLSQESIDKQLDVIKRLGFAGIYIDKRGFTDHGQRVIEELSTLLGSPPTLIRRDNEVAFFRINPIHNVDLKNLSTTKIMEQANYIVTRYGPSYPATIAEGINFTRSGLPLFLKEITGLSNTESWGRWSDATLAPYVQFDFVKTLPQHFNLAMSTIAFGPNINKKLKIVIGDKTYKIKLIPGTQETYLSVDLKGKNAASIKFFPPEPASPEGDGRKLGVGFIRLQIDKKSQG